MSAPNVERTHETDAKPSYVPPKVVTYTSDEILEQVGPAQACTISDGGIG